MARGAAPPLDPEALKGARLVAGLSQAALARAAGTDRRQIIRYENGEERPEIGRLAALARACEVTVADLVDEDALPPGLAGLRISAGLTMAAAAAALGARLDPHGEAEIATNRASLSYAERGRMPLSWQHPIHGLKVRLSMAHVYDAHADAVRTAWRATFPDDPYRPPAPRAEDDQGESEPGSLNATSHEAVSETPPPSLVETAVKEVDMSTKIGPGWILRQQGPHIWLVMHDGQVWGTVQRYRARNGELSRGWEALRGVYPRRVRRSATDQGKFGRKSSFLWRSRDLAAWGIAINPDFAQPSPGWARRPRK